MKLTLEKSPEKTAEILSDIVSVDKLSQLPKTARKLEGLSDSEIADSIEHFRSTAHLSMRKAVLTLYMASLRGEESFENVCKIYSERYKRQTIFNLRHAALNIVPFLIENKIEVTDIFNLRNGSKYFLNPEMPGHKRVLSAVKKGVSGNALARLVREIKAEQKDTSYIPIDKFEDDDLSPEDMAIRELEKSIRQRIGALARKKPSEALTLILKIAKEFGWKGPLVGKR